MKTDRIRDLVSQVDRDRLSEDLFYLARDPLPYRTLNRTLPGHRKSTLEEADDYLEGRLRSWGYAVEREAVPVQAFRRDHSKPLAHQYAAPDPADPWYTAVNLYAKRPGVGRPEEIIVLVAHKDSQSWIESPGAYDNAVGTVAVLEIARVLGGIELPRSVWYLLCNEEHTPWTSAVAANSARARGDNLIAILNLDGLAGKSQADIDAARRPSVTAYTLDEGRWLADLMAEVNERYEIGLTQSSYQRDHPNDDDGSFIKAGFPAAVVNIGSFPYADPCYHLPEDTADRVDLDHLRAATQATLAAVVAVALRGAPPREGV